MRSTASLIVVTGALLTGALLPAGATAKIDVDADRATGALTIRGAGDGVLRESTGAGVEAGGRLGFLAAGSWHHATSVARRAGGNGRLDLTLATDDPVGRRIELRLQPGRGVAALNASVTGPDLGAVESVGIGFGASKGERMLGFGERSDHVDQRGNTVESYVGEGPFQDSEYGLVSSTIPPWGIRRRSDASYFPMPWLLSSRGYGVLADNLETSRYRLDSTRPGEWSVEVDATDLSLRFFAGPEPADVVRRLTAAIGRQPEPAAPWVLGPWVQTGHQNTAPDELQNLEVLRDADAPVSVAETHMRYMPCGSDVGQEAAEAQRTADLHARGLAAISYTREAICAQYPGPFGRAVVSDAILERADGTPYTFQGFVGSVTTQIGMFDFTDPDAYPIYSSILDRAYAAGYDGWMEDYGEYAPPDSVADNGMTGERMHNYYPVVYHQAGQRYATSKDRPIVRFNRSGYTGVHPHAQIVWGGDPTTGWGFDGLQSSVREALTMGLSGISTWGSDIGGFFTLSDQRLDAELLARWLQFGAFSGVMRTKAEGIGVPASARPQVWQEPTLPIYRRYAKLRTQLYPYLVAADETYQRTGMPMMRQLALEFPSDGRAIGLEDQYMFGPDLLVAPVVAPGLAERGVYLPRGRWVNLWRSARYRTADGALELGRAKLIRGGRSRTVAAPLEEIPLMARAGTLLPMLPARVETLAPYAERDYVGLGDRRDRLHVIALPRGSSRASFYRNGTMTSRELPDGGWRLRVDAGSRLKLDLEASMQTLKRPFVPGVVERDGRRVRGWSYDERTRVLNVATRIEEGTITVRP